jgi:glycosyltransferase involved in cell wall biosynthesis
MFSVVVSLYNKASYIEKAIYSIINQTYYEFEIIIIDDGSTDDSWICLQNIIIQVRKKYPDLYSKMRILQQNNQGVSATRNRGVAIAKYDYIAFGDADDWWCSSFLEEIKNLIEGYPDAGIFSFFVDALEDKCCRYSKIYLYEVKRI